MLMIYAPIFSAMAGKCIETDAIDKTVIIWYNQDIMKPEKNV